MSPREPRILALLTALALTVTGCGISGDDEDSDSASTQTTQTTTQQRVQPRPGLPSRPSGVVVVDGETNGSLTDSAVERYRRRGGTARINTADGGNDVAVAKLCQGQIDIADTSRAISRVELQRCRANGLEPVELLVASDAVVVATRNERDVGADCLTITQVRNIFRRGSRIREWRDIESSFDPDRVETVGPDQEANEFDFFGIAVLDVPQNRDTTLSNFRSDYSDFRDPDDARRRIIRRPEGVVGFFRFSYYEQFEDQLRPLELDNQSGQRCVFPSQDTVTSGTYPLSRRLLAYTTQRSLARPEVQAFLVDFMSGAPELAVNERLVPLPQPVQAQQLAKLGVSREEQRRILELSEEDQQRQEELEFGQEGDGQGPDQGQDEGNAADGGEGG